MECCLVFGGAELSETSLLCGKQIVGLQVPFKVCIDNHLHCLYNTASDRSIAWSLLRVLPFLEDGLLIAVGPRWMSISLVIPSLNLEISWSSA